MSANSSDLPRVLVVEDEEHRSSALVAFFSGWRCVVDVAETASQAISHLSESTYRLAILDLYLAAGDPRLDRKLGDGEVVHWGGVLVLEEIARRGLSLELVVSTASLGSAVEIKRLWGLDFHLLDKPVNEKRLLAIARAALGEGALPEGGQ